MWQLGHNTHHQFAWIVLYHWVTTGEGVIWHYVGTSHTK